MKKKSIALLACVVLLLALVIAALWYTRPMTVGDLLGSDVEAVSCTLMRPYTTTDESGTTYFHNEVTDLDAEVGSEAMTALLAAMEEIPCRASLLGLLPHTVTIYRTGQGNLSISIYGPNPRTDLYLFSHSTILESIGGKRRTYLVDASAYETLTAVVEAYGVLQPE